MRYVARVLVYLVPLAGVLGALVWLFSVGLDRDPRALPSTLIDHPLPDFALDAPPGREGALSRDALLGQVSLLNVFGSWCAACVSEHETLLLIKADGEVRIHGIDWKEKTPQDGADWLKRRGDPYDLVGMDPDSRLAIDLGVTGAPETYVVDCDGVVRYKHIGPITTESWMMVLRPIVLDLKEQGKDRCRGETP